MPCWHYRDHQLYIENVSLQSIAEQVGTPTYVYSRAAITSNWEQFETALTGTAHRICYAVKANSNLAILHLLAQLGAGFDIVSVGELQRVMAAGSHPANVIFSGVGKTRSEIESAIQLDIHCFNVESLPELHRINEIATSLNTSVNIALRLNPDIDAKTHAHISTGLRENKFGIDLASIPSIIEQLAKMPALQLIGLACHIGSQITQLEPFLMAIDRLLETAKQVQAKGIKLKHMNIGGGLGITYHHEKPPSPKMYIKAIQEKLAATSLDIIIEPGRALVGNAGILLTKVEYLKHTPHKHFAITDAGMNDLLRPALYDAWQGILPVVESDVTPLNYDIVGPVCESADYLGRDRKLALSGNDLLAIDNAGAYGFSMSSNYNSRGRCAEVLVDGDQFHVIRKRELLTALFADEIIPL